MSAASKRHDILKERAALLAALRHFFAQRNILEVDCPLLTRASSIDLHIDLMKVNVSSSESRFLITSPEYAMKRLLSEGLGDIYQLSHVFRREERGRRHNPEFMLIEWYRVGMPFSLFIEETLQLIQLAVPTKNSECLPYHKAYLLYAGIDPGKATRDELIDKSGLDGCDWSRETLIDYIWSFFVEPKLGDGRLTVICDYPPDQAALAKTVWKEDRLCAERFEVYYKGVELANGYHELADAKEQRERLVAANEQRLLAGKESLPLDEAFLKALESGFPDCCGVAVGFDRLLMLKLGIDDLQQLLPFGWDQA